MEHDHIMIWGFTYCSRCGAQAGTLAMLQDCTGEVEKPAGFGESVSPEPIGDPIGDAVRESYFDRMDKRFKNK